jgi:hypothetical protein
MPALLLLLLLLPALAHQLYCFKTPCAATAADADH